MLFCGLKNDNFSAPWPLCVEHNPCSPTQGMDVCHRLLVLHPAMCVQQRKLMLKMGDLSHVLLRKVSALSLSS